MELLPSEALKSPTEFTRSLFGSGSATRADGFRLLQNRFLLDFLALPGDEGLNGSTGKS